MDLSVRRVANPNPYTKLHLYGSGSLTIISVFLSPASEAQPKQPFVPTEIPVAIKPLKVGDEIVPVEIHCDPVFITKPDTLLLEPTWRKEVKRVVDAIPEMSDERVLGEKVKGVQMAATLYLPEKVKLTGDT